MIKIGKKLIVFMCVLSLSLIVYKNVQADNDDYCSGTWSDPTSLTIQWFDSIYDYYSATSVGFWWNTYTSNVKIASQSVGQSTNLNRDIRIKGSSTVSYWGSTINYKKVLGVSVPSWTGNWSYSNITINTNDLMKKSLSLQKKVVVHEIGHALGLDHPSPDNSHSDIKAIMKQGDNGYYTIQSHDSTNLKAKYN